MSKPAPRFPLGLDRVGGPAARARERELLRPQRLLHEAARDAQRQPAPAGLGLDSGPVRERMVARLRAEGIHCEPVFEAMRRVPRHCFVDTALANQAYEDTSLPIGHGQTISKPSVVARMIELLFGSDLARSQGPQGHLGRVLEIGTGCGYQTALLATHGTAGAVGRAASEAAARQGARPISSALPGWRLDHVRLVHGDGMLGHAPNAPYDHIIAAAGGDDLPQAWLDQLAVGGRLVAPMHRSGGRGQVLVVIDSQPQGCTRNEYEAVHFVPLKSGVV